MKWKRARLWLVFVGLVAGYFALLHVAGKYVAPRVEDFNHRIVGPFENRHPTSISFAEITVLVAVVFSFLVALLRKEKVLDARRSLEQTWLWIVFGVLTFIALNPVLDYLFSRPHSKYQDLPLVHSAHLRLILICGLIALGIALYQFKRRSLIAFGAVEILVAVLTNRALLEKLDLSTFPKVKISSTDLIAFGALALLLSQGIADVADGVKIVRDRRLEEEAGGLNGASEPGARKP